MKKRKKEKKKKKWIGTSNATKSVSSSHGLISRRIDDFAITAGSIIID